jgi:hypothetical protein
MSSLNSTASRITKLGCAACVSAMLCFSAAPASAAPGPNRNSCGKGSVEAHEMKLETTSPGGSEINEYAPGEFGCTGPKG